MSNNDQIDAEVAYAQRPMAQLACNDRCEARYAIYPFCRYLGKHGSDCFESKRVPILWLCVVLQTVALIFFSVAMAGVSSETAVIKSCAWAEYHADGVDAYMNYEAIRVEYESDSQQDYTQELSDVHNNNDPVADHFAPCHDASGSVLFNMVCTMVLAAMWPYQSWQRIRFDHGCAKFNCTLGIAMQIVFTWVAVGDYQTHCIDDVNDRFNSSGLGLTGDLKAGPGYILCWLGCFLEILTGTIHMLLKAPIPMQYGPIESESCCKIEFEKVVTFDYCCCPHVQDTPDVICTKNPSAQTVICTKSTPEQTELDPPGANHEPDGVVGKI